MWAIAIWPTTQRSSEQKDNLNRRAYSKSNNPGAKTEMKTVRISEEVKKKINNISMTLLLLIPDPGFLKANLLQKQIKKNNTHGLQLSILYSSDQRTKSREFMHLSKRQPYVLL